MKGIEIRLGMPADSDQIANLLVSGFHPDVAQLMIYGCEGASEYIKMQLHSGCRGVESTYVVAEAGGRMIGAAELRRQPDRFFLNYIPVCPEHRGCGVGTLLLAEGMRLAGMSAGRIGLDVLSGNAPALRWYRRLGFEQTMSMAFVELACEGRVLDSTAYVSGLVQADLCQKAFGFSNFTVIVGGQSFVAGRIGREWFRLIGEAGATNRSVLAVLHELDRRRRIFAIVPDSAVPLAGVVRTLAWTSQMEQDIGRLIATLSHDLQISPEPA